MKGILFTAIIVGTGVLAMGCSDDADEPEDTPTVPAATASPTTEPEATATLEDASPEPATPTLQPTTPTTEPNGDCPVEEVVCTLADSLEVALDRGDYGAIVDLMQPREATCPGGQLQGAGGPFPLCEGASQGEVRTGYILSRRYSEGFFSAREGVITFLQTFVNTATPGVSDEYGSGEVRLQAVSCVTPEGGGCEEAAVIFAAILDGNRREVLAFFVPLPASLSMPISTAQNGIVLEDEEAALFEIGGEVFNYGEVYILAN